MWVVPIQYEGLYQTHCDICHMSYCVTQISGCNRPKNMQFWKKYLVWLAKQNMFPKCTTGNKLRNIQATINNKLELFCKDLGMAFLYFLSSV